MLKGDEVSKTFKLHELIKMAEHGDKFEAISEGKTLTQEIILNPLKLFPISSITADWTVTFKRDPRVIWVNELANGALSPYHFNRLQPEDCIEGNRIKFIEVIEKEIGE